MPTPDPPVEVIDRAARPAPAGSAPTVPPRLVLALGNPSRGDDALGPALAERLQACRAIASGLVEVQTDFQLQVEHVLDLEGREGVLFVDAARRGSGLGTALRRIGPHRVREWTSHALAPGRLLAIYEEVQGRPPPQAWQLSIRAESFGLGEALTRSATVELDLALDLARRWIDRPDQEWM